LNKQEYIQLKHLSDYSFRQYIRNTGIQWKISLPILAVWAMGRCLHRWFTANSKRRYIICSFFRSNRVLGFFSWKSLCKV